MLESSKNAFWQALIVTIAIFIIGIFIGLLIEQKRGDQIDELYLRSEIFLMDVMALNDLAKSDNLSCSELIVSNLQFADRIYEEASLLENYDSAEKLGSGLELLHRKYDLLRTFLWMSAEETRERCKGHFSVVVYLYNQESEDLTSKATQNVWSRVLFDLKQKKGAEVLLIPLAVDGGLYSVDAITSKYDINRYPAVIIDGQVITELKSVNELEAYLI